MFVTVKKYISFIPLSIVPLTTYKGINKFQKLFFQEHEVR